MRIADFIPEERIACAVKAASKKRALEVLAALLATADPRLDQREIFDRLMARERLGSTALGHGVAIPHSRMEGVDRELGALVRLVEPVDFDAADEGKVDLLVALLVPEASTREHLEVLAQLAEMLRDPAFREALRHGASPAAVHRLLEEWDRAHPQRQAAAPGG
ncbi:MAG: PTS sugar transporter subunit IIA [Gammaproteobacteria bacterium]|nr:MAG: PTS sugar transporter subunit IIA [Gammaproteobacteria bacterium]